MKTGMPASLLLGSHANTSKSFQAFPKLIFFSSESAESCGEPTKECSTEEDWDESWNTDGAPETTTTSPDATTSDAMGIAAATGLAFSLLFL